MNFRNLFPKLTVALTVVVMGLLSANAAEPKTTTVITIKGMHCAGCAMKVAKKLEGLDAVASAKVDADTGKATIVPEHGKTISPKLLWETVEAAKYTPTRLEGPSGRFIKKPKS